MNQKVKRYFQLKQHRKEIEQEMAELRGEIINHCTEQSASVLEVGNYKVKLVLQERKEYDDNKLYEALPDLEVWRLLSRPDPSKITSLVKLNVISEEKIKDTYTIKHVALLQVEKM